MKILRRLGEMTVLLTVIGPVLWFFLVQLAEHGWK
jgi:hypothetical protein